MTTHSQRWWPMRGTWRLRIPEAIWWRWLPGVTVSLPWPSGQFRIQQEPSGIWDMVWSADPNEVYRPWLEEYVGRQGWDWQWRPRLGTTMITPGYEPEDAQGDRVEIKFRRHHDRHAVMAILKWT